MMKSAPGLVWIWFLALRGPVVDGDGEAAVPGDVHVEAVENSLGDRRGGLIGHQRVVDRRPLGAGLYPPDFVAAAMRDRNGAVDEVRTVAAPARSRHVAAEPVVLVRHETDRLGMIGVSVRRAHGVVEHVFVDHVVEAVGLIARGPAGGVLPQHGADFARAPDFGVIEQGQRLVLDRLLRRGRQRICLGSHRTPFSCFGRAALG
jgi:hypothetical protein